MNSVQINPSCIYDSAKNKNLVLKGNQAHVVNDSWQPICQSPESVILGVEDLNTVLTCSMSYASDKEGYKFVNQLLLLLLNWNITLSSFSWFALKKMDLCHLRLPSDIPPTLVHCLEYQLRTNALVWSTKLFIPPEMSNLLCLLLMGVVLKARNPIGRVGVFVESHSSKALL